VLSGNRITITSDKGGTNMLDAEQWLQLRRLCVDTVRAVLADIPTELLLKDVPPMGSSIGGEIAHLLGAEAYWLQEVAIEPRFARPSSEEWSQAVFDRAFDQIQEQYEKVLAERGLDRGVLFGLGRVCQHALYHSVRTTKMRAVLQPGWTAPEPYKVGSWGRAADYLTDLLIVGKDARPMGD
jgi:hypothetical protein